MNSKPDTRFRCVRTDLDLTQIKDRVRKVRMDQHMTQTEFAQRLGVIMNHVSFIENGRRAPSPAVIREICRQFGVRETWMRTGTGEPYRDLTPAMDAAERVRHLMVDHPDSVAAAVISLLLEWEPDGPEWTRIEDLVNSIKETHK